MTARKRSNTGFSLFVLGLLGFFWFMGGAYWGLFIQAVLEQADWKAVDAEVLEAKVTRGEIIRFSHNCSTTDDRGPRHLQVKYAYTVGGKRYTGRAYDTNYDGELFCNEEDAQAALAKVRKAGKVTAHYDPRLPSQAVLYKEDPTEVYVVSAFFAVAGLVLWGFFLRQYLRYRQEKRLALIEAS